MIADAIEGKRMNTLLNRFPLRSPGGIVLGSLISLLMTSLDLGWQAQIWVIMIPTLIYVYLFFGQEFPKPKMEKVASIGENFKAMLSPLYLFILGCMASPQIT